MHPELIDAIKERIDLGHSKEAIRAELHEAGYDDQMVEEAYNEAQHQAKSSQIPAPNYPVSTAETGEIKSGDVWLPSATTLFGNGWKFVKSRPELLLFLAAPFVIAAILTLLLETAQLPNKSLAAAVPGIIGVVALVSYLYIWASAVYTVIQSSGQTVSFSDAFSWARKNIGGLLWVNILTGLAAVGGFLLFIIPGVIVSIYLYLAQVVYVKEGNRGMSALLRSRELVRGNGQAVLGRLVVIGLIFLAVFMVLGLFVGLVASLIGEDSVVTFILDLFFQFLGAGATLIGVHVGMEIYQYLATIRPITTIATTSGRGKYIALAWLGVGFISFIIFLAVTFAALGDVQKQDQELSDWMREVNIEAESAAKERAAEMRVEDQIEQLVPVE